jgi:O-antigen ligase
MAIPVPTRRDRLVLGLLLCAPVAVVLLAAPYKLFDLDRFFVPKELALHVTATVCALLLLSVKRRVTLGGADLLLAFFLVLSVVSALFATNHWAAWRATSLSASGIIVFWCASAMHGFGWSRRLVAGVMVAVVAGAVTALVQAYAGPVTELFSLNRAPGGTFGNRNFMAHLCAIGAPALAISTVYAATRRGWLLGLAGTTLVAAALVLSRSRAAWLAVAAAGAVTILIAFVRRARGTSLRVTTRGRATSLLVAAAAGVTGAAYLPNQLEWKSSTPYLESVRDVVNYREGSGQGRLRQYTNSLELAASNPLLGVGPGNWSVEYPAVAARRDASLADDPGMTDNPWPSSDWVAFLTERGALATLCLGLAMLGLIGRSVAIVGAPPPVDGDERYAAGPLILIGTLVAAMIVGVFDASLLLAVPATTVWILAGAVAERGARRRGVEPRIARWLPAAVIVLSGFAAIRSGLQWNAMAIANYSSGRAALERAAHLDPGSYKIHMRAANASLNRGDCRGAAAHAGAASSLYPIAAEPKAILKRCR